MDGGINVHRKLGALINSKLQIPISDYISKKFRPAFEPPPTPTLTPVGRPNKANSHSLADCITTRGYSAGWCVEF